MRACRNVPLAQSHDILRTQQEDNIQEVSQLVDWKYGLECQLNQRNYAETKASIFRHSLPFGAIHGILRFSIILITHHY